MTLSLSQDRIAVPASALDAFCRRWNVRELSLFGSVLREDFSPDSDVDVLVAFEPEARRSLFDLVEMRDELMELFGRDVDLVSQGGLRNPFRRHEILTTRQVLYAA
jgi:predicted nucleotidyltransferase